MRAVPRDRGSIIAVASTYDRHGGRDGAKYRGEVLFSSLFFRFFDAHGPDDRMKGAMVPQGLKAAGGEERRKLRAGRVAKPAGIGLQPSLEQRLSI